MKKRRRLARRAWAPRNSYARAHRAALFKYGWYPYQRSRKCLPTAYR